MTRETGDLLVTLNVKPNRPGQNVFLITAANTRRPPPGEVKGIVLRFTRGSDGASQILPAQQVGTGQFRAGGGELDLAGPWRIDIAVERAGMPDQAVPFAWTVPRGAGARDVVLSDRPLGPVLTIAALTVGALVLVAAALAWPRSPGTTMARPSSVVSASRVGREA